MSKKGKGAKKGAKKPKKGNLFLSQNFEGLEILMILYLFNNNFDVIV